MKKIAIYESYKTEKEYSILNIEQIYNVKNGEYLYYVDGYTNPQEIRALSVDEQFLNLFEIAKAMNKTKDGLISYMLEQNKDVDYQNIPENDFETETDVDEWWKDKDSKTIFKVYDEYYGIAELIAKL